jgi:hypothetical protein
MSDIAIGDRATGCQTRLHTESDGSIVVANNQDVTAVIKHNEAHKATISQRARCAKDGELAGSIPMAIVTDLMKKGIWQDDDALLQWLELPENAAWKMHPRRFA